MSKAAYSKQKGNKMENEVFRDIRNIMDCYKSIGSGNGLDSGDLLTNCFCIEIKHHKTLTDGQINNFWVKIVDEAAENNKEPILIYKENRREPLVMFFDQYRGFRRIIMKYGDWLDYLRSNAEGEDCTLYLGGVE